MKKIYTIFAIVLFAVAIPSNAKAQDTWDPSKKVQFMVGANFSWEGHLFPGKAVVEPGAKSKITNAPYYYISGEARFTRHSGLELNIACRNNSSLSIPILYKFYSRILNFAVGVNVDIPLNNSNYFKLDPFYGLVFRLTKDIKIYKGLYIEPQIQINPNFEMSRRDICFRGLWVGGGVGIKYRF